MNLLDSICGTASSRLPEDAAGAPAKPPPDSFVPTSDVPHKRPQSLQDLLRSRNATPAKPADEEVKSAVAETPELRASSVLRSASAAVDTVTVDQLYGSEDATDPGTFVSAVNPLNEAKEDELEGISVMVYSDEGGGDGNGGGGGIDGLCAFNDIQVLAGYHADHTSLADAQQTAKPASAAAVAKKTGILRSVPAPRAAVPALSSSSISSSSSSTAAAQAAAAQAAASAQAVAMAALADEAAALRATNELLTLQLARQTDDLASLSEQVRDRLEAWARLEARLAWGASFTSRHTNPSLVASNRCAIDVGPPGNALFPFSSEIARHTNTSPPRPRPPIETAACSGPEQPPAAGGG